MAKHWMVRILSHTLTLASTTTTSTSSSFLRSLCSATSSATFALKNVTRSNFDSALGELRRLVREADFVAIDLEMTGVTSAPWRESVEFDRFDIHYLKVKDSAEKFATIQFGVCPFRWDPSKASFVAHPLVVPLSFTLCHFPFLTMFPSGNQIMFFEPLMSRMIRNLTLEFYLESDHMLYSA